MKIFLVFVAFVTLAFAVAVILLPAALASVFGVALDPGGQIVARLFGASLLGWGILNGLAASLPPGRPLGAILWANFVEDGLTFLIALAILLQGSGGVNDLGWLLAAVYLVFSLGFGYYAWRLQREVERA